MWPRRYFLIYGVYGRGTSTNPATALLFDCCVYRHGTKTNKAAAAFIDCSVYRRGAKTNTAVGALIDCCVYDRSTNTNMATALLFDRCVYGRGTNANPATAVLLGCFVMRPRREYDWRHCVMFVVYFPIVTDCCVCFRLMIMMSFQRTMMCDDVLDLDLLDVCFMFHAPKPE